MRIFILILIICLGCKQQPVKYNDESNQDNTYTTFDFSGLEEYLKNRESSITVVNFWATWCKPCIKELPYFEKITQNYSKKEIEVILVSLDFPEQLERLDRFIKKHNLQSELVFLNDGNANEWIPKVDKNWSGAIPATILFNKNKRRFFERSFTYDELIREIENFKS